MPMKINGTDAEIPADPRISLPDLVRAMLELQRPDPRPCPAKIGITGTAVANAIYNATGKRVRDLPITLDKPM